MHTCCAHGNLNGLAALLCTAPHLHIKAGSHAAARHPPTLLTTSRCAPAGLKDVAVLSLGFTAITDASLDLLARGAPQLQQLTLARSHSNVWTSGLWSTAALQRLQQARPQLQVKLVSC